MDGKAPAFEEDLAALAASSFAAADGCSPVCRNYHATWTYRRLLGTVGGIEADRPRLMPLIREISSGLSCRRWLVAGSADSGILATLAASFADAHAARFIVVDRCPTPLAACRAYAEKAGLSLEIHAADISSFALEKPADAIVAHSVINFFPVDEQPAVLVHLKRQLRRGGHFLLCTRIGSIARHESEAACESRILAAFGAALATGRLVLPEPEADFARRLCREAHAAETRDFLPATPEVAVELLRQAGFGIERILPPDRLVKKREWAPEWSSHRAIIHARA